MCNKHTLGAFFNDRQIYNTVSIGLEHSPVNSCSCYMKLKETIMTNECFTELFTNFTRQRFVTSLMQGWRMNKPKSEWNFLLVFYWSTSKMKYIFLINSAKRKYPTQGQFYLSCPTWQETELMDTFKCWAKCILFWFVM